jgi:HK97 family phage prohead protease
MSQTLHAPEGGIRRALVANLDRLEIRKAGNGEDFTITGHAAVFDKWSEDLSTFAGSFREKIIPGAFAGALAQKPDVRLLFNHDGLALARTKSNTLELSEDEEGLRVWARVAGGIGLGNDLRIAMERGDIDQMSFAFTIAEDEWHEDHEAEMVERVIIRVDELFDVSVVTYPAYPDTDAAVRELRAAAKAGFVTPEQEGAALEVDIYLDGDKVAERLGSKQTEDTPQASALEEERAEEAAQAETDPAGDAESRDAVADGNDDSNAPAETDPVAEADPLAALKRASTEAKQAAKDDLIRLTKEMLK